MKNMAYSQSEQKYLRKKYEESIEKLNMQLQECNSSPGNQVLADHIYRMKKMDTIIHNSEYIGSYQYRRVYRDALTLLLIHFTERVDDYLHYENINKAKVRTYRTKICDEIDEAITHFWRMIEQDSQSIWNANRIVNPSNPGLTAISYVSPKLYSYYSGLLNAFSEIYSKKNKSEERKYAFCVNPIPGGSCQAKVLFEGKESHGKVCMINLPEKDVAEVRYNLFLLFHEFFHVLPRRMRLRKERYGIIWEMMCCALSDYLSNEESLHGVYQVLYYLIRDEEKKNTIMDHDEDHIVFYSKNVKMNYLIDFQSTLDDIAKQDPGDIEWAKRIKDRKKNIGEPEWETIKQCMTSTGFTALVPRVQEKIDYIIDSGELSRLIETIVKVSREVFSDLYTILTLCASPNEYSLMIDRNCSSALTSELNDGYQIKLRYYYVGEIMKMVSSQLLKEYGKYNKNRVFLLSWTEGFDKVTINSPTYSAYRVFSRIKTDDTIKKSASRLIWSFLISNEKVQEIFCSYFFRCIETWKELYIQKLPEFENIFRQYYFGPPVIYDIRNKYNESVNDMEMLQKISKGC